MQTTEKAINKVVGKYVQGGPQLWVSKVLYDKGQVSTNRLWEEYVQDRSEKMTSMGDQKNDIIPSKTFLRNRVLATMEAQGFIIRARADDVP